MNWRSMKIWLPLLAFFILVWVVRQPPLPPLEISYGLQKGPLTKELPLAMTTSIDWLGIVVKVGGIASALMSVINFGEKIIKWFKKGRSK